MGGETERDLAAVGLGLSQAFNESTLQQLFRRRQQEEDALRQASIGLAETGQLHLLPEELTKGIAKRAGKTLFETLNQLSQLKEQELGPRRQARGDFLSLINQQVPTAPAIPGGQISVGEPQGAPQIRSGPGGNLQVQNQPALRTPERQQEAIPEAIPDPEIDPAATGQVTPITPVIDPNPARLTFFAPTTSARSRPPTAFERTQRINNLSGLGVALAFSDNALGQLQIQSQQVRGAADKLSFARAKDAYTQGRPKFEKIFDTVNENGERMVSALFSMPDGTAQTTPLGAGAGGVATQQALTALQKVEDRLLKGGLTDSQRTVLETRRERLDRAFGTSLKRGGITVTGNQDLERIFRDGRYLGTINPTDNIARRRLLNLDAALQLGSSKETQEQRTILFQGNQGLALIDDILNTATADNVGVIGTIRRKVQSLASIAKSAPRFFSSYSRLVGEAKSALDNAEDKKFAASLLREFDTSADFIDATTKALAVVIAKIRDPNSVVKQEEYRATLEQLQGDGGFPAFITRMGVTRRDVARRMIQAHQGLLSKQERIRALTNDPEAVVPLIDPSLNLPEEITRGTTIGNVPGRTELLPSSGAAANIPPEGIDQINKQLKQFMQLNPNINSQAVNKVLQLLIDAWIQQNTTQQRGQ